MRIGWWLLAAFAIAGPASAEALWCDSLFYGMDEYGAGKDPQGLVITITLDTATMTARMGSDIGWVEGPVTKLPESYSGTLRAANGETRNLYVNRFTGNMSLTDNARQRLVFTGNCRLTEPRF